MVKQVVFILLFFLTSLTGISQSLISYVTVNPDKVYIGQPVELKVSVYTSTWFTSGINVGNIKVDGALTVYFSSLSQSRTFSGKQYAGVDFFYNLFPTKEGEIIVPALEILVESPKEGGYKGIKHTVRTKPKSITVNGVPLGYSSENWLVSRSLNITEKWSTLLNNIKVGDVLQRTISRSANGTLSEFIPETKWDSVQGVSIYPKRPITKTNKSKVGVSAQRSETVNYLFEKEGEITIPGIEYVYWNSSNKRFYKKQIDTITISVQPNPDLTMLNSIKKSLQKEKEKEVILEEKEFLILGLKPKTFLKYLIILLATVYVLIKLIKKGISLYSNYREKLLESESYAFNNLIKTINKRDFKSFLAKSNTWISKLNLRQTSWDTFLDTYGTIKLKDTLKQMNELIFKHQKSCDSKTYSTLLRELKISRKNYFENQNIKKTSTSKQNKWLNPTSFD